MLQVITILIRCHHFLGFVYQYARFASGHKSIAIAQRLSGDLFPLPEPESTTISAVPYTDTSSRKRVDFRYRP